RPPCTQMRDRFPIDQSGMATSTPSRPGGRQVRRPSLCPPALVRRARNTRRSRPQDPPPARGPSRQISSRVFPLPSRWLPASARTSRYELASLHDLRSDRISIFRERDGRGVVLSRLRGIASLFRGRPGAERGPQPVRFLFQGRLEGGESFLGHATLKQHHAIKL